MNKSIICRRVCEMLLLFLVLPLLYFFFYDQIPVHKFIPMLIFGGGIIFYLLRDKSFSRKKLWFNSFKNWRFIFLRFIIAVVVLSVWFYFYQPDMLFYLPRHKPLLWLMIMIFYPLFSVYPQELIFRAFFFHRYQEALQIPWLVLGLNALFFGLVHLIFNNWIAVLLTILGGWLFADTYRRSQSLMVVAVEHALYGCYVFTIGIGQYFYIPTGG